MTTDPIHITITSLDAPIITDALRREIAALTYEVEASKIKRDKCIDDGLFHAAYMHEVVLERCERSINTLRDLLIDIHQ